MKAKTKWQSVAFFDLSLECVHRVVQIFCSSEHVCPQMILKEKKKVSILGVQINFSEWINL